MNVRICPKCKTWGVETEKDYMHCVYCGWDKWLGKPLKLKRELELYKRGEVG